MLEAIEKTREMLREQRRCCAHAPGSKGVRMALGSLTVSDRGLTGRCCQGACWLASASHPETSPLPRRFSRRSRKPFHSR